MDLLSAQQGEREIRIFISSTFRDMMPERDYLVKEIFPKLRTICRERGADLTDVDLRWGVTESQAQEGKVIEICLKEIDRCRPYFLGLIGGRYGWVPEPGEYKKYSIILEEFPWVKEDIDQGLSITEMEIQYGVLKNPKMHPNAFFYLRDPKITPSEFKEAHNSEAEQKLFKLKDIIRTQKYCPVKDYGSIERLGDYVYNDLLKVINELFPPETVPDPITKLRNEHSKFARSRLRVYIGGEKYFNKLDEFYNSNKQPLVLTGEQGSGKSALLANWLCRFKDSYSDLFYHIHFIGGASDSTDYVRLVRRLMEELKIKFDIKDELPDDTDKLIPMLPGFLAQTGKFGKWILIIDALNQLDPDNKSHLLNWLPEYFPPYVRVVLTTLHGDILEILKKRNYEIMEVHPLDFEERKKLIVDYLHHYSKELSEDNVDLIASDKESENPLILRTELDELRIFGVHEKIKERIETYISTESTEELFRLILSRMEQDYEKEKPGLVGELLSMIWASRKGMSETELLNIAKIPPLYWSPIYNSLENHLIKNNGLLNISNDFLRQTVEHTYLKTKKKKKNNYIKLADYFENDLLSERTIDELPYLLVEAEEWERLKNYLSNIDVFMKLWKKDFYEVLALWTKIINIYDVHEIYNRSLKEYTERHKDNPEELSLVYYNIAKFYTYNTKFREAKTLLINAIDILSSPELKKDSLKAEIIDSLATVYAELGDFRESELNYKKSLQIKKSIYGAEHTEIARGLSNLAVLQSKEGRFKQAEPLLNKSLEIRKKTFGDNHYDTATTINNLAYLKTHLGKIKEAEILFEKSLHIFEKLFGSEHLETAKGYNNLATIFGMQGKFQESEVLFKKALKANETILGPEYPETAKTLNNLAKLYRVQRMFKKAEPLYLRSLRIREKVYGFDNPITAQSYNNVGAFYQEQGMLENAKELIEKGLDIRLRIFGKNHFETADSYNNLAILHQSLNEYKSAEINFIQALKIYKTLFGDTEQHDKTRCEYNLGNLYMEMKNYGKAADIFEKVVTENRNIYGKENQETLKSIKSLFEAYCKNLELTSKENRIKKGVRKQEAAEIVKTIKKKIQSLIKELENTLKENPNKEISDILKKYKNYNIK